MTLLPGSLQEVGNEEGFAAVRQPPPTWGEVQRGHALSPTRDTPGAAGAAIPRAAAVRQPRWGAVQRGNSSWSHAEASDAVRHSSGSAVVGGWAVVGWEHSQHLAGVGG